MAAETSSIRLQKLFSALNAGWSGFEHRLLSIGLNPDFSFFLAQYRGVRESAGENGKRTQVVHELSQAVIDLVSDTLKVDETGASDNGRNKFEDVLKTLEGALNLAIYFWHGPGDRNFQFRTLVHFCSCPEDPILVSHPGRPDFFLRVTEWGVQLSASDLFLPFPFRFSLERACDLRLLRWNESQQPTFVAQTIATLRVVQREFCQLIDEWEHCNSLLAVRQFGIRKMSPEEQPRAQQIFADISRTRDLLAKWCAGSAADFQERISEGLAYENLHPDVAAELSATDALLLSGFQKFFLPASVSRHIYGKEVIEEFDRFAEARLRAEPDDVAQLLARAAFSGLLRSSFDWEKLIQLVLEKSFRWSLGSDPASAIKSVAWSFTPQIHQLLTAIYLIALNAKREPGLLEPYWLQSLASIVEMPSTFGGEQPESSGELVSQDQRRVLNEKALGCLSHFANDSNEENRTANAYVGEFLRSHLKTQGD
jgi:hypothetical protein